MEVLRWHTAARFLMKFSKWNFMDKAACFACCRKPNRLRLGDDKYIPIDVRIIAATNKKLPELVAQGKFRQDSSTALSNYGTYPSPSVNALAMKAASRAIFLPITRSRSSPAQTSSQLSICWKTVGQQCT